MLLTSLLNAPFRAPAQGVYLEPANLGREREFLTLARASRELHEPWVYPPRTRQAFRTYVERLSQGRHAGYFVCAESGGLAGVININEMIMGGMCSGALGYYGFAATTGQGLMREGLALLLRRAFTRHGLHRLEANVQPGNLRSRILLEHHGFRCEGLALRLLKIEREWRDHERWALTIEEWREQQRR
jgi:[ribosomal protein S5]-alanine N-acetyltransferase